MKWQTDVAADQARGIGRTGMISTDSPGKVIDEEQIPSLLVFSQAM
jgi:hypothetical protein